MQLHNVFLTGHTAFALVGSPPPCIVAPLRAALAMARLTNVPKTRQQPFKKNVIPLNFYVQFERK